MKEAEVSLFLVHELYHSIADKEPEKFPEDNPYVRLASKLLNIDFCLYDCHLTTNEYLEAMARYAVFFRSSPDFFGIVIQRFFSPAAILNAHKSVASTATYEFMKLCQRFKNEAAFTVHYDATLKNAMEVIQACEEGKISDDVLGHGEVIYLYDILSVFAADATMDQGRRQEVLTWALTRQMGELEGCPQDNKDKLCRIIATIKTIT